MYSKISHDTLHNSNHNSSTAPQFSCYTHRPKRSRTSPHSPDPPLETLTTASGRDYAVDVSHRQLSMRSGWQLVYQV